MLLSKRLKELRINNGLTQRELGERVNVTKVSICCYENGTRTPTLETLTKLGEVLNVSTDELLGYDNSVGESGRNKHITKMAKEEIKFILELRKNKKIYEAILEDPKQVCELINKKGKIK